MKPHILSEPEERLLALGSSSLDGYDDLFSQLTDVDMKFGILTDDNGEGKPLTQSSYSSFLVKRNREVRKQAFHQFYQEFRDHQFTLASSLAYSVKADVFRARARNYPSALEASLFRDDVPGWSTKILFQRFEKISLHYFGISNCDGAFSAWTSFTNTTHTFRSWQRLSRTSHSIRPSRCARGGRSAGSGIHNAALGRITWALVRSIRNERKTQRSVFVRQFQRAPLHPDELQKRRLFGRLHTGP